MRKTTLFLLLTLAVASSAASADPVSHLCGGIGKDARQELLSHRGDYNLGIWMTQGPRNSYLDNVALEIRRDGVSVASFTADGPICLVRLPPGAYTVIGRLHDQTRQIAVRTGELHAPLRW